jgi:hypothetical protein
MRPNGNRGNGNGQGQQAAQAAAVQVPFTAAAHEHTELAFDTTVTPGAGETEIGPFDVPAYGYLRHMVLTVEDVDRTGVLGDVARLSADYPFNVFSRIELADVNGGSIFGPLGGYAAMWTNTIGGYSGRPDPRTHPDYDATITPKFMIRVPVEISRRDGFGSLANQSTAANYKLYLTLNSLGNILTGSDGRERAPTLRIRGWLEAWSLPNEVDFAGRRQAETPPMLGTSMYHSHFLKDVQAGDNTILLPKVGNLLRWVGIIARDDRGDRDDTVFFDPADLQWDARSMRREPQQLLTDRLAGSIPELAARDAGVFAYLMDNSTKNTVGDDAPTLWYPTVQSSRLQFSGQAATAGTLEIITCDIAPVEVAPSERYVETSQTGFRPAVGTGVPQG